jgi:diaminopropionate ammonia-lyase
MQLHMNTSPRFGEPLTRGDRKSFGADVIAEVREYMAPLRYAVTSLHRMNALAQTMHIGALLLKDESARSSLGSFKALGGAYAVIRLVVAEAEKRMQCPVRASELSSPVVREIARDMTVACATDGNHGRSVAAGARLAGCHAVIFVHSGVSEPRVAAMRELGAQVIRVRGSYDDSVAEVIRIAADANWLVVSDTSWPGYEQVPTQVMQGYLMMVDEVLNQCHERAVLPTHVFLQAGVGGFAAAVAAHMSLRMSRAAPRFVVVEPERAACLFKSAIAQQPVRIPAGAPTFMAMLECYEPSLIAWRILESLACGFIALEESEALRAMQRLAFPFAGDPFVLSGESGGAGLAGVMAAAARADVREMLGLDQRSVVLVFNTEGATDRLLYESLLSGANATFGRDTAAGQPTGVP